MPVVTVHALADRTRDVSRAATEVGAAVASAAGEPADGIFVVWSDIAPGHYVIAGSAPTSQPSDTHPPLVEISAPSWWAPEAKEAIMHAAADSVARQVGVAAANVRVLYLAAPHNGLLGGGRIH